MMPIHSAAGADQKKSWPGSLRITNVALTPDDPRMRTQRSTGEVVLHQLVQRLVGGWKWLESKRTQQLASRRLRLAETISLGEKRSISIVQVDGSQYLIGCSSGSVQLLATLDSQHARTQPPAEKEATS